MDLKVIRNTEVDTELDSDELQHHGIKGMRWGQRRYQNKDGSLTDAGKRRYNKEMEKLKEEEKKVKAAEKVAANKQKTQAKIDKLDAKKAELEERKKALKGKKDDGAEKKDEGESIEQKRERLLKSTNPKEILRDKDVLSNNELQDRLNRINLESQLRNKDVSEGLEYMNNVSQRINSATNLYKTVDNAYSTVINSSIGKTLAKQLGIETPKKERESLTDFMKNIGKKSDKEIQERAQTEDNIKKLRDEENRLKKQAEKDANDAKEASTKAAKAQKAADAKKAVDDYNERWQKGESDDKVRSNDSTYSKSGDDLYDDKVATGKASNTNRIGIEQTPERAETDGKVYGEGSSKRSAKSNDTVIDAEEGRDYWYVNSDRAGNTTMSNATNSRSYSIGQNYIAGLLEDKNR